MFKYSKLLICISLMIVGILLIIIPIAGITSRFMGIALFFYGFFASKRTRETPIFFLKKIRRDWKFVLVPIIGIVGGTIGMQFISDENLWIPGFISFYSWMALTVALAIIIEEDGFGNRKKIAKIHKR